MDHWDFEPGRAPVSSGVFVRTCFQPAPREPRLIEPDVAGPRAFDPETLCWVLVRTEPGPCVRNERSLYRPASDGSRVAWVVRDARTGVDLCPPFTQATFDRALAEKRLLCRSLGGKSGWARLVPVEGS